MTSLLSAQLSLGASHSLSAARALAQTEDSMRRPPPPPGRASDGRVSPRGFQRGSAEQAPAPPERYRRDRPPTPPYDRSRQRPPARGPAPVLLRNKEVDALYELLGWVQDALEGANVPWTLTGGSALGAIRSESILFCDDDIDIAIIGRPNVGKARGALKAIRGAYYQDAGGRKGLPWDRIRHKSSPKAWVDVFLLVEYASLDELRKAVSTKRNGEPQATDEIERATQFCASLPSDAWPLYHFGELDRRGGAGLAIRRWPRERVRE